MQTPEFEVLSHGRLYGSNPPRYSTTIHLSILDSVHANLGPVGAIWYYDGFLQSPGASFQGLIQSLQDTLDSYPQFTGKLNWVPFQEGGDRTQRYGRVTVTYGASNDPGICLITAERKAALADVIPDRASRGDCWEHDSVPAHKFIPEDMNLALYDGLTIDAGPTMIIKLTKFLCGGLALAIRGCHVLMDSVTMMHFLRDWTKVYKAINNADPLPTLNPIFDPSLLDAGAVGDLDGEKPDEAITKISRSLPIHRFDWWASGDGAPAPFAAWTKRPQVLDHLDVPALGTSTVWKDLDLTLPISHYRLHFTKQEVEGIYQAASTTQSTSAPRISRLDAFLAHLWSITNRARDLQNDDSPAYIAFAFNCRPRLSPPLASNVMGSPIILANAQLPASTTTSINPGPLASAIRLSILQLNPSTMPAMLHDMAHQVHAQRYCQWTMGQKHFTTTSWIQQWPSYLDFGVGELRYLDARLPDYFVAIVEGQPPKGAKETPEKWYEYGVDVVMNLETQAMEKILRDPLLRVYRERKDDESDGSVVSKAPVPGDVNLDKSRGSLLRKFLATIRGFFRFLRQAAGVK